ncbi:MAG: hypothetical protein C4521_13335 [Actinobacteria bacterium]|nr:MAG: hypothetical protein C4521_13335 [Actinomycetota bacterium]
MVPLWDGVYGRKVHRRLLHAVLLLAGSLATGLAAPPNALAAPRPGMPRDLQASFTSSGMSLTWRAPARVREVRVAGYVVYRSHSPSGSYKALTKRITGGRYLDRSARAGGLFYRVVALSASGARSFGSPVAPKLVHPPAAPTGLAVSADHMANSVS